MSWGSGVRGLKRNNRFALPGRARGKHESDTMFARRMERMAGIEVARSEATTVERDGREFKVLRLPDDLGL